MGQFSKLLVFIAPILIEYISLVHLNPPQKDEVKRFNNIKQTSNDKRSYRGLILENKLKVMLVSDPSTEKAAASMVVAVGSLNDFKDVDGLANLVGYTMAGSKEFQKFLDENGTSIAQVHWTDSDHQLFNFDINADQFIPALNQFAKFFAPLTLEELLHTRWTDFIDALSAVEREFQFRKTKEVVLIDQVEKLLSKPNHKYNHFFCGNLRTLRTGCVGNLIKFYDQWYSSNNMYLSVLGREDLDTLEALVISLFKGLKNKNLTQITYKFPDFHPWGPDQLSHKLYIVPLQEEYEALRLTFPVPDLKYHCGTPPERYISYLLTRSGPGSLLSGLHRRKLCREIRTKYTSPAGIGFFTISCALTEHGVSRVDDIADLIFQYLSLILSDGVNEYIFNDLKTISKLELWHEIPSAEPADFVVSLSTGLRFYPMDDRILFRMNGVLETWEPTLVTEFLMHLTPESMNMTVVSKAFERIARQKETYYKTRYKIEKIPSKLIDRWYASEMADDFKIPPPNKFMPRTVELYHPPKDEESKHPRIIRKSSSIHVWFTQAPDGSDPRMTVWLEIIAPFNKDDYLSRVLRLAYWSRVNSLLEYHLYAAKEAGFEWDLVYSARGMTVQSIGHPDTMANFLVELVSALKNTSANFSRETFEDAKKSLLRTLKGEDGTPITTQAAWFSTPFFVAQDCGTWDILLATRLMRFEDMKQFCRKLYSNFFISALLFGNCDEKTALELADVLEKEFVSKRPLLLQEILKPRTVQIEPGSEFVYQMLRRTNYESDISYFNFYQFGAEATLLNQVASFVLARIINAWCADVIQDTFPEGDCVILERDSTIGIALMAVAQLPPSDVELVMETSLGLMFKALKQMTNEQLNVHKENLMVQYYTGDTVSDVGLRYWLEIVNRTYRFDRMEKELEILDSLTLDDVMVFFLEYLHQLAPGRGKLRVQLFPFGKSYPGWWDDIPDNAIRIEDVPSFHRRSALLPDDYANLSAIIAPAK